jgi:hypothetical protein
MFILKDHIRSGDSAVEKKLQGIPSRAVAFIVGNEVAEVLALEVDAANLLLTADRFKELPVTPPLFYVDVIKDKQEIETIQCDEKMWAILSSEPTVIDVSIDTGYSSAIVPGWSYVNGEFKEVIASV